MNCAYASTTCGPTVVAVPPRPTVTTPSLAATGIDLFPILVVAILAMVAGIVLAHLDR